MSVQLTKRWFFKYKIIYPHGGINIGRVVHFDINANEPDRAMKFYTNVFNWKFEKWEGPMEYWLITTGEENEPGIDGGMTKTNNPGIYTGLSINTNNIDDTIGKIRNFGGTITQEKMAIPGVGWFIGFKDTEGNQLGAMQHDPQAH